MALHGLGQHPHGIGQCGAEQQGLALAGQQRQHAACFIGKTIVEQAVGLVQHQHRQIRHAHRVLARQVEQAAGRHHQHMRAAAQRHHLRVDGQAAHRDHGLELRRQRLRCRGGLHSQFTCGRQHQRMQPTRARLGSAGLGQQLLQQRQQKSPRLASACGRLHQHISAGQHRRNGHRLHRARMQPARRSRRALQARRQTQGSEVGSGLVFAFARELVYELVFEPVSGLVWQRFSRAVFIGWIGHDRQHSRLPLESRARNPMLCA